MGKCIATLAVLLLVAPGWGRTLTVDDGGSADFRTIGDAIASSSHGDTIVVQPGTYREQVNFNGRRITVRSENPDDPTVVKGTIIANPDVTLAASVVFNAGEREESVLTGFTITAYGILCSASSPTITKNVISNGVAIGIRGQNGAAPTIIANEVLFNTQEGIYSCEGLIQGNAISGNKAGIASCGGPVLDNIISENVGLGGIASCSGEIAGNRIVGNYAALDGGGLYNCDGSVHHNIIAGNRADRSGGGLSDCDGAVYNNTIFGNRAASMGGGIYNCPRAVYNNIISYNEAMQGAGLYGLSNNTYNIFWLNRSQAYGGGAIPGTGDDTADPLFVAPGYWDGKGTSTTNDDVWVDDPDYHDYHLKSKAGRWEPRFRQWVTDTVTSRCIDAGRPSSDWAAELWPHGKRINVGAYGGTPEASMSASGLGSPADLNHDEQVWWFDLELFAESWAVQEDLLAADLNRDGLVDGMDFALLGMQWRTASIIGPPIPSPMTWAVEPYPIPPDKIAMVATTATSTDGTGVEYYFKDDNFPNINSGWVTDPCWVDGTDHEPETLYWYRVKARNRGNGLETEWSEPKAAELPPDIWPPEPNAMTWEVPPYSDWLGVIRMTATTATDESGVVRYAFRCTSNPTYNSGWQPETDYDVAVEVPGYYKFTVEAQDKYGNTTEPSEEAIVDLEPPQPNPMTWQTPPHPVSAGVVQMIATTATDKSGVEYQFECTSHPAYSSSWQDSPTYEVSSLAKGNYTFKVRARDKSPYQSTTEWSQEATADLMPPTHDPMQWEDPPYEYCPGSNMNCYAKMKAVEASDDSPPVEYYFECTLNSDTRKVYPKGFSSGWQTSREWTVLVGRWNQALPFRVMARDKWGNTTGWSMEWPALPPE